METLVLLVAAAVAWQVQHRLVRRRLDQLSQTLDAMIADSGQPYLDFFRSPRMRKLLSNATYAKLLNTKAQWIRESIVSCSSAGNRIQTEQQGIPT
jgi:hypothetical protein